MTGKVDWQQGSMLLTDITILHRVTGPGTNKNGKCLLHGKFNAINPCLCLHSRYCKWILVRLLFPAAGALAPACWELVTQGSLYVKAPSAGPAWHGNKATLNQQIIPLPPRKWTSQQSNSPSAIPSIRNAFPDWCNESQRSGFLKCLDEHAPYLSHTWGGQKAFSPNMEDSRVLGCFFISCQGSSYLVEGNATPQEMFPTANPFIFMERILLILRYI